MLGCLNSCYGANSCYGVSIWYGVSLWYDVSLWFVVSLCYTVTVLASVLVLVRVISPLHGSRGLSVRRGRRMKSRGPKGLQLEVGALRAPWILEL